MQQNLFGCLHASNSEVFRPAYMFQPVFVAQLLASIFGSNMTDE